MKKKLLSFVLCSSLLLYNTTPIFANTFTSEGTHQIDVEGEIVSTFEVVLPASIELQSKQASVDFDVVITANTSIGDEEILCVTPEEVIYLSKNESDDEFVQALVYQDKKKFAGTELGYEDVKTVCTIETGRLSSGLYKGVLKFNITLGGDEAIIVDSVPRSWNYLLYNNYFTISDDGVLSKGTADLSGLTGTLTLSNRVKTIDTKAFEGSGITTIVLSQSVENINDAAFMSADSLQAIEVAEGNTSFLSTDGVLFSADGTKLLAYPAGNPATDYKIPAEVTEIGNYAFAYCTNIASLTIPSTVTKTGQGSFTDMSVMSSKYADVTMSIDTDTAKIDNIQEATGSILLAKKVNGFKTAMYSCLQSTFWSSDAGVIYQRYAKDFNRVLTFTGDDYEGITLWVIPNSYSYLTSLDGLSVNRKSYNAVKFYEDEALSVLDKSAYRCRLNSKYNHFIPISTDATGYSREFDCDNIVFSDINIYDTDNNLIYKADITK